MKNRINKFRSDLFGVDFFKKDVKTPKKTTLIEMQIWQPACASCQINKKSILTWSKVQRLAAR
jgi:hypothetical protein